MQPHRRVLARVLMTVLSIAIVAGAILAARPASARAVASRRPDALADAASAALVALGRRAEVRREVPARHARHRRRFGRHRRRVGVRRRSAAPWPRSPRRGPASTPPASTCAWTAASDQRMTAVLAALSQVGVPYRGYKAEPGLRLRLLGPHQLGVERGRREPAAQLERADRRRHPARPGCRPARRPRAVPRPRDARPRLRPGHRPRPPHGPGRRGRGVAPSPPGRQPRSDGSAWAPLRFARASLRLVAGASLAAWRIAWRWVSESTRAQIWAHGVTPECLDQAWIGPAPSRSDGRLAAGAQGDDLGADRDGGLLGRAGADVEADRRHDAVEVVRRR